ncbi:C-terminal-binding protein [Orchesella cincta]|uniref:C-terminal-binding protein n=1 Tax=Orchesella cincta TaxID=48709 RepID=A0A1D2MXN0_ORCCI|nr:C-terminal-binding protein [Orchesella cincta]
MPILKDVSTVAFCDASSVPEIHQKVIVKLGPGVDNIDLEAAADLGIAVCHVNDNGIEEAADTALGLILDLYRKINWFDKMSKEGKTFKNFESIRTAGGGLCQDSWEILVSVALECQSLWIQCHFL